MDKLWKVSEVICAALFVLLLAACGKTQEQAVPSVPPEKEQTEEDITDRTAEADMEDDNTIQEESDDNPYRNRSEAISGPWMEALYEIHKGVPQIEAGEVIYAFDLHPDEDSVYRQSYTCQITLPFFLDAQDDEVLQKIQKQYLVQDWMLTEEEKEEYMASVEDYKKFSSFDPTDGYNFWRAYRQDQFITVIFEDVSCWGRWFSWPYADVFWADTGERVTLEDLFGEKIEELEQILAECGRKIPVGCVLEEWEDWDLNWELLFEEIPREVPLPREADRSFYPTPYGVVFSYTTGEISAMAQGAVLVFVDWESLKQLKKY